MRIWLRSHSKWVGRRLAIKSNLSPIEGDFIIKDVPCLSSAPIVPAPDRELVKASQLMWSMPNLLHLELFLFIPTFPR